MTHPVQMVLNDEPLRDPAPVLLNGASAAVSAYAVAPILPPETSEREQLLDQMQQDREELINAAARLRGPVHTIETARKALALTSKSIPWIALAGNLMAVAMWLKRGRGRPPVALLLSVSYGLFKAWSSLTPPRKESDRRPPPLA